MFSNSLPCSCSINPYNKNLPDNELHGLCMWTLFFDPTLNQDINIIIITILHKSNTPFFDLYCAYIVISILIIIVQDVKELAHGCFGITESTDEHIRESIHRLCSCYSDLMSREER